MWCRRKRWTEPKILWRVLRQRRRFFCHAHLAYHTNFSLKLHHEHQPTNDDTLTNSTYKTFTKRKKRTMAFILNHAVAGLPPAPLKQLQPHEKLSHSASLASEFLMHNRPRTHRQYAAFSWANHHGLGLLQNVGNLTYRPRRETKCPMNSWIWGETMAHFAWTNGILNGGSLRTRIWFHRLTNTHKE